MIKTAFVVVIFWISISLADDVYPLLLGCYPASEGRTEFSFNSVNTTGQTKASCFQLCSDLSYPIAGLSAGNQCLCGTTFGVFPSTPNTLPTCPSVCVGDNQPNCGGPNSVNVYQLSYSPPDYQWADKITNSSTHYPGWDAYEMLGGPNFYPGFGDSSSTWAPLDQGSLEYIELTIPIAVQIIQVDLYETWYPGALINISTKEKKEDPWTSLWNSTFSQELQVSRIFSPPIARASFASRYIRFDFDLRMYNDGDWYELDCVKITGKYLSPNTTENATSIASSIDAQSSKPVSSAPILAGLLVVFFVILLVVVVLLVFFLIIRNRKKNGDALRDEPLSSRVEAEQVSIQSSGPSSSSSGTYAAPNGSNTYGKPQLMGRGNDDYESFQSSRSQNMEMTEVNAETGSWDIASADLVMEATIGSGAFGAVYAGTWRGAPVAIKVMKSLTSEQIRSFKMEFDTMKNLRPHANVIQLYGVCKEPFAIVTELMTNGSLWDLIEKSKITDDMCVKIATGIARGMLHLHYEKIIHRDLAARNVLLTSDFTPKISDFGLSRLGDEQSSQTESVVGPLKWMSPENITSRTYSTASDVWSYGITLIELYTRDKPYPNMDAIVVATQIASKQLEPTIPSYCPPFIVDIMNGCFQFDPKLRPSFKTIVESLQQH